MLTRRHVRIKVMQSLYSYSNSKDKTLKLHLVFFKNSINKSIAEKLWNNISETIEKRSLLYVNRYTTTEIEIATLLFDRERKIRFSGTNGKKYIQFFQSN